MEWNLGCSKRILEMVSNCKSNWSMKLLFLQCKTLVHLVHLLERHPFDVLVWPTFVDESCAFDAGLHSSQCSSVAPLTLNHVFAHWLVHGVSGSIRRRRFLDRRSPLIKSLPRISLRVVMIATPPVKSVFPQLNWWLIIHRNCTNVLSVKGLNSKNWIDFISGAGECVDVFMCFQSESCECESSDNLS